MKNAVMDSSVDWMWLKKESVILKTHQQKLSKLKGKGKKKRTQYPGTLGQLQKMEYMCNGDPKITRKKGTEEYWNNG